MRFSDWSSDVCSSDLIEIEGARLRASLLDLESGEEVAVRAASGSLMPIAALPGGDWIGYHYSSTQPTDPVLIALTGAGPPARQSVVEGQSVQARVELVDRGLINKKKKNKKGKK